MSKIAVYDVNNFILNHAAIAPLLGMPRSPAPLVAVQDRPEIQNPDYPWLVYSWRYVTDPSMWWENVDEVSYAIISPDIEKIDNLAFELSQIFKKMDKTAEDLNDYLASTGQHDNSFLWCRVTNKLSPDVAEQEGGNHTGLLVIRYSYVMNADTP